MNFIFVKNVKRHIYDVKFFRLGHDLSISVYGRVISTFRKGNIFMKVCENKTLLMTNGSLLVIIAF